MAYKKKFKMTLTRGDHLFTGTRVHEQYHYQYRNVLTVYNPRARDYGADIPHDLAFMIPILEEMGFKVDRRHRHANEYYTGAYVIGVSVQQTQQQQLDRYPQRYVTKPEVQQFISDHSRNGIFKALLRIPKVDWALLDYLREPLVNDMDDATGFEADFVEVAL